MNTLGFFFVSQADSPALVQILLLLLVTVAASAANVLRGGVWIWLSMPCYALLGVATVISSFETHSKALLPRYSVCIAVSGAFASYILIRTLASPVEHVARNDLYMLLAALIVYLLFTLKIGRPNFRGAFVVAVVLLGVINVVVGTIQFVKGDSYAPIKALQRIASGSRASGFFGNPNHLAGFLEVAILLGASMTFWSRWRIWAKILLGYFTLICLAGLVLTGSRGGYLSIGVGTMVFVVLSVLIVSREQPDRLSFVLGTLGSVFLVLVFVIYASIQGIPALRPRLETTTTLDHSRMRIWPSAVQQFELSPIFGTGSGTFLYYGRQFREPDFQMDPVHVHNDYLHLLAEFGLVGMAGFLAFLGIHLRNGWLSLTEMMLERNQYESATDTPKALLVGALSAIAALMVHSVVDFNLHVPSNTLIVAFLFAILATPREVPALSERRFASVEKIGMQFLLPALGLWLLISGLPKLPGDYFAWKARSALVDWTTLDSGEYARRAEDFARRGLKYDSKNPELCVCLGDALFARAELPKEASQREVLLAESAEVYREALKLAPPDRNIALALGWSLDALQRFEESRPFFERAVALDPNSSYVRWAYAAHLHLTGDLAAAKAEYEKAAPFQGGENARRGLQKLAEDQKKQTAPDAALPKP